VSVTTIILINNKESNVIDYGIHQYFWSYGTMVLYKSMLLLFGGGAKSVSDSQLLRQMYSHTVRVSVCHTHAPCWGMRCHLAGTLVLFQVPSVRQTLVPHRKVRFGGWNPQSKFALQIVAKPLRITECLDSLYELSNALSNGTNLIWLPHIHSYAA